ncbi:hypothetical protein [Microbacterium pumilum]|uniref:Uncharacterized protein n=1 Tax=Microbacterium pumilum TaxID=344165 RepID=A0ABP5EBN5_9MICO
MAQSDSESPVQAEDEPQEAGETTEKPGGLGQDGTIPAHPGGVAAGHTGTASTFEPEEDEQA